MLGATIRPTTAINDNMYDSTNIITQTPAYGKIKLIIIGTYVMISLFVLLTLGF